MKELKKGDKIKVKSLDWYNKNKDEFGYIVSGDSNEYDFDIDMKSFCGTELTITQTFPDIEVEEASNKYGWETWMFEENYISERKYTFKEIVNAKLNIIENDGNLLNEMMLIKILDSKK